jgi:hypothetical protein
MINECKCNIFANKIQIIYLFFNKFNENITLRTFPQCYIF